MSKENIICMLHFGNGSPILPYLQRWHWFRKMEKTERHCSWMFCLRTDGFARCKSLDCRDWSGFKLIVQMSDWALWLAKFYSRICCIFPFRKANCIEFPAIFFCIFLHIGRLVALKIETFMSGFILLLCSMMLSRLTPWQKVCNLQW